MNHAIIWALSAWAAFGAFVIVNGIGKHRKPTTPAVASIALAILAIQIFAYAHLYDQL